MKKRILLIFLIILSFLLAGCVRFSMEMDIKADGKVDVSMLSAVAEGLGDDSFEMSDEKIKELKKEGWSYQKYDKDGYVGYVVSIKNKKLDDLAESMDEISSDFDNGNGSPKLKKKGSIYCLEWDLDDAGGESDVFSYGDYINNSGGYMKFVLHLPSKAIKSNATDISDDGKTLTWDLLKLGNENKIYAEFKLTSFLNTIVVGLVTFIFAIAFFITLFLKKKLISRSTENNSAHYCSKCGSPLDANDMLCDKCGASNSITKKSDSKNTIATIAIIVFAVLFVISLSILVFINRENIDIFKMFDQNTSSRAVESLESDENKKEGKKTEQQSKSEKDNKETKKKKEMEVTDIDDYKKLIGNTYTNDSEYYKFKKNCIVRGSGKHLETFKEFDYEDNIITIYDEEPIYLEYDESADCFFDYDNASIYYNYLNNDRDYKDSGTEDNYEENTVQTGDGYILPYSNEYAVTDADLRYLSSQELTYARNEIYARHGYIFKSSELNNYFASKSWYEPNPDFGGTLYGIEQSNANYIKEYQEKYNLQYKPK